jgi:drug/metabolite transporter (DMT)-like permease
VNRRPERPIVARITGMPGGARTCQGAPLAPMVSAVGRGKRVSSIRIRQKAAELTAPSTAGTGRGKRNDPIRGLLWVVLAMILLAGLGVCAKYVAQRGLHPLQIVFFRNFFCVVFMLPLLHFRGSALLRSDQISLYGVRVGISLISMAAWFHALALIPLGELTAISFLSPLFGTLGAIFLLGEVVRARRWAAVLVGFMGAMIILRPGGMAFGWGEVFALVSAMANGLVAPMVKQLTAKDDADKIVFITNLMLTPVSLVAALFVWEWPPLELWPLIVALGFFAWLGHITLVRGYASIDASLAMTFEFSRLPFAVGLAWLVFGETTDLWTWVGALIIFTSAVYITRREAKLRQAKGGEKIRDVTDPLCLTPVRMRF